jgi:hypothetical protein
MRPRILRTLKFTHQCNCFQDDKHANELGVKRKHLREHRALQAEHKPAGCQCKISGSPITKGSFTFSSPHTTDEKFNKLWQTQVGSSETRKGEKQVHPRSQCPKRSTREPEGASQLPTNGARSKAGTSTEDGEAPDTPMREGESCSNRR